MDYYSFMEMFKKGIGLVAIIFGISIIRKNVNIFSTVSAPYIIVYLVFSVVLLRTLRYMEYNKNSMDINKINLKYSAIITTLSLTISMKPVREFIFNSLYQIYNFIINMLFYLLSWPIFGIGYVMQFIVYFVKKIISTNARQQISINVSEPPFENIEEINRTDIIEFLMKNKLVNTLLQITIFVVIIWLFIKIFGRQFHLKREEEEYIESREFITEKKENNSIRRLPIIFRSRTPVDYIRIYYLKYLRMCKTKKIDIKNSDTTFQINDKAKDYFDSNVIKNIREIYIKVRYGGWSPDNTVKGEFYQLFKDLTKISQKR
ncbi:MAG: hypothetical protein QME46_11705 [Thermoanaerobacteraceae bacterium]|nr:hypothetical protein [Thermoanaerobacteraceae bacterium]